jgi:biotin operon repressor
MSATLRDLRDEQVLMVLAKHKEARKRNPKESTIARKLGISPRTVMRSIKALEQKGYLKVEERRGRDGRRTTNRYVILGMPSDQARYPQTPRSDHVTKLSPPSSFRARDSEEKKSEGVRVMGKSWEEVTKLQEQAHSERVSGRKLRASPRRRAASSKTVDDPSPEKSLDRPSSEPTSSQGVGVGVGEGVGEDVRQYELELAKAQDDLNQWHYVNPKTGKQFTAVALVELRREARRAKRAAYSTGR